MKKHIFAVIMALLSLSLIFTLAACGDDTNTDDTPKECVEHTFGEWETETYGTCASDGLKIRECTVCGFEEEQVIEAGHKWSEWETVSELTCTQHGLKTRVCEVCTFEERDEKEAQGHLWDEGTVKVEGDCQTDTVTEFKCQNCPETKEETSEANGHDWSDWGFDLVGEETLIIDPTCTEDGYKARECKICGEPYSETQPIPAQGHDWSDWDVTGSCAEGATRTRACSVCEEEETETTLPGEHANVVYEGAKAPTLEEDGSTGVKKCLACGETLAKAKTIRIMNYALSAAPSTSSWAVVASYINDGDMNTGVTGYGDAVRETIHTLTWTKAVGVEEITLYFSGDATGKNIGGTLSGQLANTNPDVTLTVIVYGEDDEEISRFEIPTKDSTEYTITLEEQAQITKIDIINANGWNTSKCVNIWEVEVFGTAYLSECELAGKDHAWGDWETITAPICTQDDIFTNGLERRVCSECGETEENVLVAAHAWGDWDESNIECLIGGTRTKVCTSCGKEETETVEAGGHVETEIQGAKEPTFEEDGSTGAVVCTKCGATVEEAKVIPKLVNKALEATATTNATFWAVVGNGSWAPNTVPFVNDGNLATGSTTADDNLRDTIFTLTWDTAVSVNKIIAVCNGTGNLGYTGNVENTNVSCDITITAYGEDGSVLKTITENSLDKTQIVLDLSDVNQPVKKVDVSLNNMWNSINGHIFEIMAIAGGKVVEE